MSLTASFSLVYGLAAAIALVAAAVVWPRRTAPGGAPLVPMLLATEPWALCDAIELRQLSEDTRWGWLLGKRRGVLWQPRSGGVHPWHLSRVPGEALPVDNVTREPPVLAG